MGSYFLDPNGDAFSDLVIVGSALTVNDTLDRPQRDPTAPDVVSYVEMPVAATASAVLDMEGFFIPPGTTITSIEGHFYRTIVTGSTIEMKILIGATVEANLVDSTVSGPAWSSFTWTSGDLTQQNIHDLRIEFQFTKSAGNPFLFSAYLLVNTAEATQVFTPLVDTYTPQTHKRWRPKITPGAFWI